MTAQAKFDHKRVKSIAGANKKQGRRCIWGQKDPRNVKKSRTPTRRMSSNKKMTAQAKLERQRVKNIAGANKKQGRRCIWDQEDPINV